MLGVCFVYTLCILCVCFVYTLCILCVYFVYAWCMVFDFHFTNNVIE
jgi:hypothetical protein